MVNVPWWRFRVWSKHVFYVIIKTTTVIFCLSSKLLRNRNYLFLKVALKNINQSMIGTENEIYDATKYGPYRSFKFSFRDKANTN